MTRLVTPDNSGLSIAVGANTLGSEAHGGARLAVATDRDDIGTCFVAPKYRCQRSQGGVGMTISVPRERDLFDESP